MADPRAALEQRLLTMRAQGRPESELRELIDAFKVRLTEENAAAQGFQPSPGGGYVRPGQPKADPSPMQPPGVLDSLGAAANPSAVAGDLGAMGAAFNENFAFGLPAKAMDLARLSSPEQRAALMEQSPAAELSGRTVGLGLSGAAGPEAALQRSVEAAAAPLLSRVPALTKTVAGRVGTQAGTGFATGASAGAAQAATQGAGAPEVFDMALLMGSAGGLLGAGAQAGGEGVAAGREALRNPRTLRGRTISGLEEGKAAGHFDTPEFKGLPEGKAGYNRVADDAGAEFTSGNRAELAAARRQYGAQLDDIAKDSGGRAVPLDNVHARLGSLETENTVNGVAVDEQLGSAIAKVRKMLTKKTGILARDTNEEIVMSAGTLEDVLKTKKAVESLADFGSPATAESRPYRLIYRELAKEAEAIDPRLAQINKEYGSTISKLERANDIVYGRETPDIAGRAASERTAAARLGRLGDDTTAGTVGERQLEELSSMDPKYADLLREIELKKAYERTRFGLPRMSKSPEKWGLGLLEQNVDALTARAVDPALGAAQRTATATAKNAGRTLNAVERARKQERDADRERARKARTGR